MYKLLWWNFVTLLFSNMLYATTLNAYHANYAVYVFGIKMGTMTQSLKFTPQTYQLQQTTRANFPGMRLQAEESSEGIANQENFRPQRYFKKASQDKNISIYFDHQHRKIKATVANEHFDYSMPTGMQDPLSCQLALRQYLIRDAKAKYFTCTVVAGKKVKQYDFVIQNTVPLQTSQGIIQTLHVRQNTHGKPNEFIELWINREYAYLPVRIIQYKHQCQSLRAELVRIEME